MPRNLLDPTQLHSNYVHQLRQTIDAYSPAHVAVGEGLQNAIDEIAEAPGDDHQIELDLDFVERTVTVRDTGRGFPNDPNLLYLGGGTKFGKKLGGLVGVGLKVVLFSSSAFSLRSRAATGATFAVQVDNASKFDDPLSPPNLTVPDAFEEDPAPLDATGTEVSYTLPAGDRDVMASWLQLLLDVCLPGGAAGPFGETLVSARDQGLIPSRLAGVIEAYLRRFTYAGNVRLAVGQLNALGNCRIKVKVTSPTTDAGYLPEAVDLCDGQDSFEFDFAPSYIYASDTKDWTPDPKPSLTAIAFAPGGTNLPRTYRGFNHLVLKTNDEFETLVTNARGTLPTDIAEYRAKLFPKINSIALTLGRIPLFEQCLPGGSARRISANGVVTGHEVSLVRGRNQEYVRCFDLTIDIDASLNYGKTEITDRHLVGRIYRYLNDAYRATIQNAAGNWVGKIVVDDDDDDDAVGPHLARPTLAGGLLTSQKEPVDENDVIGLFFELCGRGVMADYRMYGLSQKEKYDARGVIKRPCDSEQVFNPDQESQLRVIEFKVRAASAISDFLSGRKDARDIHLLICWELGTSPSNLFGFGQIGVSRVGTDHPDRVYPHVTHFVEDTRDGTQVQILVLKEIIAGLPEPESPGDAGADGGVV